MYSNEEGWDQETYDKKVAWTGGMIKAVDADIWGFQELWHAKALKDVFKAAKPDEEYALLVPPGHAGASIVCAGAVRKNILIGDPE
jgi:hypothetical protein